MKKLLIILCFLPFLLPFHDALAAAAWVQTTVNAGQVTATPTVTINSVAAGSTIVVFISCSNSDTRTVSSISDTVNTYSIASAKQSNASHAGAIYSYYTANVGAGNYTITVTMNASATYTVSATEISGLTSTPLDQNAGNNNGGGASQTLTVGAVTTTQANEMLVGLAYAAVSGRPFNSMTGWTNRLNNTSAATYHDVWTQSVSSTGSYSLPLDTSPNNQFIYGYILTFKEASAPSVTTFKPRFIFPQFRSFFNFKWLFK